MNIKHILTLAAAAISFSAAAQVTAIAEIDYNKYHRAADESVYWATGLAVGTKFGTFDGYAQGVYGRGPGYVDSLQGFEFGYTVPGLSLGKIAVMPRIAYGQMHNVGVPGTDGKSKYALVSTELNMPIKEGLNGYVSASHMKGYTPSAIASQNRLQAGVDVVLTEKLMARIGYSAIRQYQTTQNGVVLMAFYSF